VKQYNEDLCLLVLAVPSILLSVDTGSTVSDSLSRSALGPASLPYNRNRGHSSKVNRKACGSPKPNAEAKNAMSCTSTLPLSSCRGAYPITETNLPQLL
jgi:hypothetical protein